jgi:hypothetical protein
MMDGMDFVDDMDTKKTHLRGYVHSVRCVHSVHYLDKFNWLRLPNLGSRCLFYITPTYDYQNPFTLPRHPLSAP